MSPRSQARAPADSNTPVLQHSVPRQRSSGGALRSAAPPVLGAIPRPWKIQSHTCAGVRLMLGLFCHSQTSTAARQHNALHRRGGPVAAYPRQPDSCNFPATVAEVRAWVAGKLLVGGASQPRAHEHAGAVAPAHKKQTAGLSWWWWLGSGWGRPRSHERGYAQKARPTLLLCPDTRWRVAQFRAESDHGQLLRFVP
jgi:hypothetical protein